MKQFYKTVAVIRNEWSHKSAPTLRQFQQFGRGEHIREHARMRVQAVHRRRVEALRQKVGRIEAYIVVAVQIVAVLAVLAGVTFV